MYIIIIILYCLKGLEDLNITPQQLTTCLFFLNFDIFKIYFLKQDATEYQLNIRNRSTATTHMLHHSGDFFLFFKIFILVFFSFTLSSISLFSFRLSLFFLIFFFVLSFLVNTPFYIYIYYFFCTKLWSYFVVVMFYSIFCASYSNIVIVLIIT